MGPLGMQEIIMIALILGMLVLVPLAVILVVLFILKRRPEQPEIRNRKG